MTRRASTAAVEARLNRIARDTILFAMRVAGVTRKELAHRMKVSYPRITAMLKDDSNITVRTLARALDACGAEVGALDALVDGSKVERLPLRLR